MKVTKILASSMLALSIFSLSTITNAAEDNYSVQKTELQGVYGGWSEEAGYFTINSPLNRSAVAAFAPSAAPKWHKADIRTYPNGGGSYWEYIVATTEWPDAYHYTVAQYENKITGSVSKSSGRVYGMDQTTATSGEVTNDDKFFVMAKSYYGR